VEIEKNPLIRKLYRQPEAAKQAAGKRPGKPPVPPP
jgi:hypothetical protein